MIFALLLNFALASDFVSLQVSDFHYQAIQPSASCSLLLHREKERAKVIREYIHLKNLPMHDPMRRILEMNHLMSNKLFLDVEDWQDELIEVYLNVEMPDDLQKAVENYGLENLYFSIEADGVNWRGFAFNFPEEFSFSLYPNHRSIGISYLIYRSEECFGSIKLPSVKWSSEYVNTP